MLKFCPKDNVKLEIFEGEDYKEYAFTEEERKILGTIRNRTRESAILAREVAEIVGCNKYKVATFVERILSRKIIGREKLHGSNKPYSYFRIEE